MTNPLTIRAGELARLPLAERRKILELQAENHLKLKAEATRRATKIIEHLEHKLEGFRDLLARTEPFLRDELLYDLEALLQKDCEEEAKRTAPIVP